MEKRLIIAISLSILVIAAYQFLSPKPVKQQISYPAKPQIEQKEEASVLGQVQERLFPSKDAEDAEDAEKETIIETDKFIVTFSNIGASIKSIKLKEYTENGSNEPFTLVSERKGMKAPGALEANALVQDLANQTFTLTKKETNSLTYEFRAANLFTITKVYIFRNYQDYIELQITIDNLGSNTLYKQYDLIGAGSPTSGNAMMGRRYLEIDSMVDGKLFRARKVKEGEQLIRGIVSWTGLKERYFSLIIKPNQESEGVILKQYAKHDMTSGIRSTRVPIYPGSEISDSYLLYAGPNDAQRLNALGMGQIINYGPFDIISKFLLKILRIFHKITKNWGVAIMLLTLVVNLVLLPLTRKSFTSMRKIQEVQPHIEKLRALHKDNPQKMNKELAELYRQYNVNPFGGCLPLIIQMPIFIALYQGLIRSIELKGAHFLWIKDLSNPDFIKLPVTLPLVGNELHILPLLMVIAMFFQQYLSTKTTQTMGKEQAQQQKIMMIFFPLFFGFLFYNFPAGLVLYWLTNTVLMVIEHSTMRKQTSTK